jgi:hypothetical protein
VKRFFVLISLAFFARAEAHPVAFKGAIGLMAYQQADMLEWQALYSVTNRYSLGVDYIWDTMEGPARRLLLARVNWLAHRWNGSDHQANIYVSAGGGAAFLTGATQGAGLGGLEADYETRRVYFSGKTQGIFTRGSGYWFHQLRAGFAPYLGDYEGLNTWLIVQLQSFPQASADKLRVGPVLRQFYKNVLWELGVSSQGAWSFNFMVHL